MSDEKKDGPLYIATKQIPRAEVPQNTLDAVLTELRAMRGEQQETHGEVKLVKTNLEVLTNHVDVLTNRVTLVERRQDGFDERGAKYSGGVRQLSETDARHDAAIANVIIRVDNVEKKVDTVLEKTDAQTAMLKEAKEAAKALWKNPAARAAAGALWAAFLYWLGTKGIRVGP